jgi:hypothetical protein
VATPASISRSPSFFRSFRANGHSSIGLSRMYARRPLCAADQSQLSSLLLTTLAPRTLPTPSHLRVLHGPLNSPWRITSAADGAVAGRIGNLPTHPEITASSCTTNPLCID